MNKKILIPVAGVVTAFLLACGVGKEISKDPQSGISGGATSTTNPDLPTPDDSPKTVKIGETLTVTGRDYVMDYTLSKPAQKSLDEFGSRPTNGVFLVVYLEIVSIAGSDYACSCSLNFIAPDGKVYATAWNGIKGHPDFQSVDITTGQKANGWVVFDVPKDALKGGRIQLQPDAFQELYGYWTL